MIPIINYATKASNAAGRNIVNLMLIPISLQVVKGAPLVIHNSTREQLGITQGRWGALWCGYSVTNWDGADSPESEIINGSRSGERALGIYSDLVDSMGAEGNGYTPLIQPLGTI
jgi:hypothetical protein